MRKLIVVYTLMMFAAPMDVSASQRNDFTKATSISPTVSMYGRHTKLTEDRIQRVTSKKAWVKLWHDHSVGIESDANRFDSYDTVEVDFEKMMVIALFLPNLDNSFGISSDFIVEDNSCIRIRLNDHLTQSGLESASTSSWGVLVIPRSNKTIVLERNAQSRIGGPAEWAHWKTLSPEP
jgi:hypothetical protein